MIDALQASDANCVVVPSDWVPSGEVIILRSIPKEKAKELFPQGWEKIRP